jgi:hypothetical protein
MLADLIERHEIRKRIDAPLLKLFGPDKAAEDMDRALEMLDQQRQLLAELVLYIENTAQANDALTVELLKRVRDVITP